MSQPATVVGKVADVFGPMVSASVVEDAVLFTLKKWFPTYLAEEARQLNVSPTLLPQPQNYTNRNSFDAEQGEKIPKVVVLTPGLAGPPRRDGYGVYSAAWRVGVGIATAAKDEELANMMVKAYGAAAREIVLDKVRREALDSTGVTVTGVEWLEENYEDLPLPSQLMLYKAAGLFFGIDVANVATRGGGPDQPTIVAPADFGQVEEVFIDLEQEVITE